MPELHFPRKDIAEAIIDIVAPRSGGLKLLRVRLIRLVEKAPEITLDLGEDEGVLDILGGLCSVNLRSKAGNAVFPEVGGRANVFAGKPHMIYLPRGAKASIFAESPEFESILFTAPARNDHPPVLVFPEEAQTRLVGKDNWQRSVVTSIGENVKADRLIVGETTNPPGNWSSAPPHKHDTQGPDESPMEEVYYYKLNPAQGFGLQRIYAAPGASKPFDLTYAVRDGDLVTLPRGYHPVVAAPGYQLLYVWALAGDERRYGAWTEDPDHAWIKGMK